VDDTRIANALAHDWMPREELISPDGLRTDGRRPLEVSYYVLSPTERKQHSSCVSR